MVDQYPADSDGFKDALNAVLQHAVEHGVDVEGGWKISTTDGISHWDIQITAVDYDDDEAPAGERGVGEEDE